MKKGLIVIILSLILCSMSVYGAITLDYFKYGNETKVYVGDNGVNITLIANMTNSSVAWINVTHGLFCGGANPRMLEYSPLDDEYNMTCYIDPAQLEEGANIINATAYLYDGSGTNSLNFTIYKDTTEPWFEFTPWITLNASGDNVTFPHYKNFTKNADIFFSPFDHYINFSINVTDDTSGVNYVYVNLSAVEDFITDQGTGGNCTGLKNLTYNAANGLWEGWCDIGAFNKANIIAYDDFDASVTSFNLYFFAVDNMSLVSSSSFNTSNAEECYNPAADGCNSFLLPINLQDLGIPGPNVTEAESEGFRFGSRTTNLTEVLDFNDVNFVVDIEVNLSNYLESSSLPSYYLDAILLNFSSANFGSSYSALKFGNLVDAIDFDMKSQKSHGDSRIYVNSSFFEELDTTTTITLYHMPFNKQPAIFSGDGADGVLSISSWVSGIDDDLGNITTGNLTFIVGGFSAYNMTDNETPIVTFNYPVNGTTYTSNIVQVNYTVNGTGTEPSYVVATINGTQYIFNNTLGGANSSNCSLVSGDLYSCIVAVNLGDGTHNIQVDAKDYGGSVPGNSVSSTISVTVDTSDVTLSITKTAVESSVENGSVVAFIINATNTGSLSITNYTIYDLYGGIPEGLLDYSNVTSLGMQSYNESSNEIEWLVSLSSGQSQIISVNFTAVALGSTWNSVRFKNSSGYVFASDNVTVTIQDTTYPYFTSIPGNQRINYSTEFGLQIAAADNYNLSAYRVSDTTNFAVNTSGYVSNNTLLALGTHSLTVTINDSSGNQNSTSFNVTVEVYSNQSVVANTSTEFDLSSASANLTMYLANNVSTVLTVTSTTASSSGTTASLTGVKALNLSVDSLTSGNITWALLKIYYNDSEISGLSESNLKIYYYNETAADWQLEPNQGVETALNYIWANLTHFSIYGVFGSAPASTPTPSSGGSGGGSGGGFYYAESKLKNSLSVKQMHTQHFVRFDIGNDAHSAQISRIYSDRVKFKISSDPFYVEAYVGKETLVDVDSDGINDLSINVAKTYISSADVAFKLLGETEVVDVSPESEVIVEKQELEPQTPPATEEPVKPEPPAKTEELPVENKKEEIVEPEPKQNSNVGGFILGLILAGIIFAVLFGKKKKHRKK